MKLKELFVENEAKKEINISPLIDMVFILLIFFVVTTVFVDERGLRANTPGMDGPKSKIEALSFQITKELQVLLNGVVVEMRDVARLVQEGIARGETVVSLEVSASVPARLTVALLDACAGEGVGNVSVREMVE